MADLLSILTLIFKPVSLYLIGGLSVALIAEVVVLRFNLFGTGQQVGEGTAGKYDLSFMRVIQSFRKTAISSGFKYKNSSTAREMVSHISSKFPEQRKILNPVLTSVEAHAYGEYSLTNEDLNNYTRWLSTAITLQVPKSRVKV